VAVITPTALQAALDAGQTALRGLLTGLTDDAARAPSALPGWTRGHVLTHIEGVGRALARQARYAPLGKQIEVYDGGRPTRDAAIEAGHGRGAAELTAALADALDEVEASWAAVGPDDWDRPVAYRDGVLLDAGLGRTSTAWSQPFCEHLVDQLGPRVPDGVRLTLTATDGPWHRTIGAGAAVEVRGARTDLAAWLAGRRPLGPLTGDPLPALGDWP
jgi:maleylpyruvate isomerase